MPYFKFGPNDIFTNTIQTHPRSEFFIYSGSTYYNSTPEVSGANVTNAGMIPTGSVSLYEWNIDRMAGDLIYPFITKGGGLDSYKTTTTGSYQKTAWGDLLTASFNYPLSASITRKWYGQDSTGDNRFTLKNVNRSVFLDNEGITDSVVTVSSSFVDALQNTLNHYTFLSDQYEYSASNGAWNKATQELNLITIPSIFYGSSIKKGSVDLKFYVSGTLIGHITDDRRNGELVQTAPAGSTGSGSVAGVVLYNEGFVILTGSWDLSDSHTEEYELNKSLKAPKWTYFGVGAPDDITGSAATGFDIPSSSFAMSFSGSQPTQVVTMFAHAGRGELNHSNNPTYLEYKADRSDFNYSTGSIEYFEDPELGIKNIVSSSFSNYSASFAKETYLSKIGLYDEKDNLIGITKMAVPVKKTQDRDLTFKIKLDI
tara:strand:+ start:3955 stop:5235 length:1281 start_codon:yes stop_codon:yes gene_type:complete